jgi:hypothetical protein
MTGLNLFPYLIAWVVLLIVVIVLAIVRGKLAGKEDDTLKLGDGEASQISEQQEVAKKLSTLEALGKWLTILLVVSGVVLAVIYGYSLFNSSDMFAK